MQAKLTFLIFVNLAMSADIPKGVRFANSVSAVARVVNAVVVIQPALGSGISGTLYFSQNSPYDNVVITGVIRGLPKKSVHALHLQEFGDLTNGCESLGKHFNPFGRTHGGPNSPIKHVGDLGNITSSDKGEATVFIKSNAFSLYGTLGVVGRSIVIHRNSDDLGNGNNVTSKLNGNAGDRIGCGIIGTANINLPYA